MLGCNGLNELVSPVNELNVGIPAGLVTPLGIGTTRVWENLLQGKCGITQIYDESMNYSFLYYSLHQNYLKDETKIYGIFL